MNLRTRLSLVFFFLRKGGGSPFFLVKSCSKGNLLLSGRNHQNLHFNKHVCPSFVG